MATNTILQSLNPVEDGSGVTASNRRQIESYLAAGSIAEGDLVALDITQTESADRMLYVVAADTSSGDTTVSVGFALADAASGETVDVVVSGYFANANVATGGGAGDRIVASGTTGRATQYAASSTQSIVGYQVATASSNTADVIVLKQF